MEDLTGYRFIDLDTAAGVMADGGLQAGLIERFLERTEARLAALSDAVASDDASACASIAHSLKGSSATYGAARMAERAADIDALEGDELLARARLELPALHELLQGTRAELGRAAAAFADEAA